MGSNPLTPDEEKILVTGNYGFDGDMEKLRAKWYRYGDQLIRKYQKPGYRIFAWWYFNYDVSPDFLSWMDNVPLAERRKYRTKDGEIVPNREHTIL